MMQIKKEKALNRILLGLAVQYIPLFLLGTIVKDIKELPSILSSVISLSALGFFVGGYVFFIKGCRQYTQSKGYSSDWGWLGLFSVFGLSILLLIPDKKSTVSIPFSPDQNLSVQPFNEINISEVLLSSFLAISVLLYLIILIFSLLNNLSVSILMKNPIIEFLAGVVSAFYLTFVLLINFQKQNPAIDKIINYKNKLNLKLILFTAIVNLGFASGFNSIALYKLSFLFPSYVEYKLNEKYFNNIPELILFGISAILLAPVIEELLFRGIVLQKLSNKWGVKSGVLTSSLLFAVLHLNIAIISIFILSIMFSVLYFKTRNLLTSILCHCFYNIMVTILNGVNVFSQTPAERETFISVIDYQNYIQPLLNQEIFLIAITAPLIGSFIYKNFPKNDAILPYYDSGS